jgi:uncharacterized protein (DUF58 family)
MLPDLVMHKRLLYSLLGLVVVFCLGFAFPVFLAIGKLAMLALVLLVVIDGSLLYSKRLPVEGKRILEGKLSNGDFNTVALQLRSHYGFAGVVEVIDELPVQLQKRDLSFKRKYSAHFTEEFIYKIRPTERGEYAFGNINVFLSSPLQLLVRRVVLPAGQTVKVYPSFIQYRKYAFLAMSNRLEEAGVKKVRQIGASKEFEQIRDYVRGDDFRMINWRATARRDALMVNQYQEEKSQTVYCLVDKGRMMHMPFEGLSLMDYAINATLVLSGIALGRGDKAGLLTFSDKIGSFVQARSKSGQTQQIAEALYSQDVRLRDTDYWRLLKNTKQYIKNRSLLLLFTNFDSLISLERQMKYLKAVARDHVLVTILFDNTELNALASKPVHGLRDAYHQTVAEKLRYDKFIIAREMQKNGIYTILTEPQQLTVNTINKYLELKSRGVL